MKNSNMYPLSVYQFNPFVGCKFDCVYCRNSFQAQAKRQKHRCMKCYKFEPHEHPERLDQPLPKTGYMQFIFTCSMGDVNFCSTEFLEEIVAKIKRNYYKTFLIQSKNPKTFERVQWPDNVILGTTIETNFPDFGEDSIYHDITKAPSPSERYESLMVIKHALKMVTIEPVLEFNLGVMLMYIRNIKPCMVFLGYDSKKNNLPEPPIEKVKELVWELEKLHIPVILKKIK